jgi:hypothetical protein
MSEKLADVYGAEFTPSLDRATDAITKVTISNGLTNKFWGVITKNNEFSTHGDVIVRVVNDTYSIGDVLAPGEGGIFHRADDKERLYMAIHGCPRIKVAGPVSDNAEIILAFIQ